MSITTIVKRKPKPVVVKTAQERLNASHTQAAAALSFFEAAAADLADAAIAQDTIAGELLDQAEALEIETAQRVSALERQAHDAITASLDNAAAASRIRELVGSLV